MDHREYRKENGTLVVVLLGKDPKDAHKVAYMILEADPKC